MNARTPMVFDPDRDYFVGPADARVTIIEYGDYTSPASRRVRDLVDRTAQRLEGQVTIAFRQYPAVERYPESERASCAAIAAGRQGRFWDMHAKLHERGRHFEERDLMALARTLGLDVDRFTADMRSKETLRHVHEDARSARAAGVTALPALFIDGRPYDDPWDELSLIEAVERPLGVRLRLASHAFSNWAASSGLLLLVATLAAVAVANTGLHGWYETVFTTPLGIAFGESSFALPLRAWINEGLMTVFFLLVGIEIKRELTVGELAGARRAALPIIGALGGMAAPALIYLALNHGTNTAHGWGVPIATDIAFALGLLAILGRRVPPALTVFLATLAIADDIGAILVVALFYGGSIQTVPLVGVLAVGTLMLGLNRIRVYARTPYLALAVVLWGFMHAAGLHAPLAGVATAVLIPSRRSGNLFGVAAQANAVFDAETVRARRSPAAAPTISVGALDVLESAIERLRDPGYHVQHTLEDWTNFLILPLFAFANTGIPILGSDYNLLAPENLGIVLGLTLGKPLGIAVACWAAVKAGLATISSEISWIQLLGAGSLAGVGFSMAIFIANAAFEGPQLSAVKLSVLLASTMSGTIGMALLRRS